MLSLMDMVSVSCSIKIIQYGEYGIMIIFQISNIPKSIMLLSNTVINPT